MQNLLPSEMLAHTTARLECTLPDGTLFGTGFFFADETGRTLFVTNKHVIEDATGVLIALTGSNGAGAPLEGSVAQIYLDVDPSQWIFHPDPAVDLCALPFDAIRMELARTQQSVFFFTVRERDIPSAVELEEFQAMETVVMVGYPNGIWDEVNNQPIIRRGVTATHPHRQYQGRSEFMLDIGCHEGSSGSPVFLYDTIGTLMRDGSIAMGPRRLMILGVLCEGFKTSAEGKIVKMGRRTTQTPVTDIPLNLGLAVKATELMRLARAIPLEQPGT